MSAPFRLALRSATALLVTTATAAANPVECVYDKWRGAESKSIAQSWVGLGFIADTARGIVQVRVADGFYPEEKTQRVASENFTGLVYYKEEKASDGSLYRLRYSFRIYSDGACEGRMDQEGYLALVGSGKVK